MDPKLKKILRGISLEIRRLLEGHYDDHGDWQAGDLERRLNELGVWRNRNAKPVEELKLSTEDKAARRLVDGYLKLREEAGVGREEAVSEFVRESAYTWANRLFALRCMEARGIIDEVILQKDAYGGRSLVHNRFGKKNPQACVGADDGLFAVLFEEFTRRAQELPVVFNPNSRAVALRPSIAALKRNIALLSGRERAPGQEAATDEVFAAPDSFGWAYQYWNADEKDRVFEMVRTKKGAKIQGADIIPATQLYTEPYMVKFLVQNSLGALWMGMHPDSKVCDHWEYYVKDADRAPVTRKPVREITFLDPAQGSGHFHLEAFDLFYAMYAEEAAREERTLTPRGICAAILNHNLYGIDIDGRSVQIATAALWMKAKEHAPELEAGDLTTFHEHLVATNIRLPQERNHLELFLQKHPEDDQLRPALELVFQGLEHADELGALVQIEELVDAVLRRLKEEADKKKGTAVQTRLFEPTLIQGSLPVTVEIYDQWKRDALNRLQAHFEAEAQAADAVQAFFGESASKGLILFNLLARRYDVVAANPPYMGSKNMGDEVKGYITRHYGEGKRDLYAAFILRCVTFSLPGGRIAMVTMNKWFVQSLYVGFRKSIDERCVFGVVADLGPGAFTEIGGEVVNCALFILQNQIPTMNAALVSLKVSNGANPTEKAALIRAECSVSTVRTIRHLQSVFRELPGGPLLMGLSPAALSLFLEGDRLHHIAKARQGLASSDNGRFLRCSWEISNSANWKRYYKGGGYKKWFGSDWLVVNWRCDGLAVKEFARRLYGSATRTIKNQEFYFKPCVTYTQTGAGCMGVRLVTPSIFDVKGICVFPNSESVSLELLAGVLSTHAASLFLRVLTQSFEFHSGYVDLMPIGSTFQKRDVISRLANHCIQAKRIIEQTNPAETDFMCPRKHETEIRIAAILHTSEATLESIVSKALGVDGELQEWLVSETGMPAGWFPLLKRYDALPPIPEGISELPDEFLDCLQTHERRSDDPNGLVELKRRLRLFYEAGRGSKLDEDESDTVVEETNEDESVMAIGARHPIPPETFVEELSQKLELHPISVYWLLKEGIEREGWRCLPEERRLTEDRFTVLVLRLLGHRWPKQIEGAEPLPMWADQDGVISLTSGGGETPLIERARMRLAENFPGVNVAALEREFEEIVGVPLEQWLSGPFFQRHISQFKKRPIAWQIETDARGQRLEVKKKKRGEMARPVFACLIYYHKMDEDLLPKIRTQYVGVLWGGFETELRTLEHLGNGTPAQQGRKLQLDQWIEEMKAFDVKLEQVSLTGFGPPALHPALRQYAVNDALLSLTATWLGRLNETVASGPLTKWLDAAAATKLHPEFPRWMKDSLSHLDHFCAVLGPPPPKEDTFAADPTSHDLAPLVCHDAKGMVEESIKLAGARWWKPLDEAVLEPLRQEMKAAKEAIEKIDAELETTGLAFQRRNELGEQKHNLKQKIKKLKGEHDEKSSRAKHLREEIEDWTCPEAETWEPWLSEQPLFDKVASLDGKRQPPQTVAEFIAQESAYAPDINDGVRVNIAPLQKAGLLHTDVLDSKDADKAIADRAEWRLDERRWVREGKLPQPGWWESKKSTT